ncbi:MAG: hypothetical protein H6608_07540 [Flavobacteriales bacterium]|nr:hypothetical protein [Bacteroidota bacterium]MCB9240967.1 hypothetical protein [Flavobacteriales bacterium]
MKRVIPYLFLLLLVPACTEVTLVQPQSGPPTISFISIEPTIVKEFTDSITIRIKYQDPDGDLGSEDPDLELLTIQDLRLQDADGYHVALLAPPDSKVSISGELEIYLKNTFLLGTADQEITSYELIMTDRAGNKSNPMATDQITIVRN